MSQSLTLPIFPGWGRVLCPLLWPLPVFLQDLWCLAHRGSIHQPGRQPNSRPLTPEDDQPGENFVASPKMLEIARRLRSAQISWPEKHQAWQCHAAAWEWRFNRLVWRLWYLTVMLCVITSILSFSQKTCAWDRTWCKNMWNISHVPKFPPKKRVLIRKMMGVNPSPSPPTHHIPTNHFQPLPVRRRKTFVAGCWICPQRGDRVMPVKH